MCSFYYYYGVLTDKQSENILSRCSQFLFIISLFPTVRQEFFDLKYVIAHLEVRRHYP